MRKFRSIGYYIDSLLGNDDDGRNDFCNNLNFSFADLTRLCEGAIGLTPVQLQKAADFFSCSVQDILNNSNKVSYSRVIHCRSDFSKMENCDKILDIIDSYIDVREAV